MVQKIDIEQTYTPLVYELNLQENDTLVLQVDQDIFDLGQAQQLLKAWERVYPKNTIMITFKGIELKGVIHND